MEESRTQRLQHLLKRLGQAVHGSVVQSSEVRSCLDELHEDGWQAVMLLEASLVCRGNGALDLEDGAIHIHVDPTQVTADYRIDSSDARLLSGLGITSGRHRAQGSWRRATSDDQPDRQNG